MTLITDPMQVREEFDRFRERRVTMLAPCHECVDELIAYGEVARAVKQKYGIENMVFTIGFTGSYPEHAQMKLKGGGDVVAGFWQTIAGLEGIYGENGRFKDIGVIPFFDHGTPAIVGDCLGLEPEGYPGVYGSLDDSLLHNVEVLKRVGTVMFDCSFMPLERNIAMTAEYVDSFKTFVTIEGAPEHILGAGDAGHAEQSLTTPEAVAEYIRRTGVDLVVPYVGTEHRATVNDGGKHYYDDAVRAITEECGRVITLHGSSSLNLETEVPLVANDGVAKFNVYTAFAVAGAQAVAHYFMRHLDEVGGKALDKHRNAIKGAVARFAGSANRRDLIDGFDLRFDDMGPSLRYCAPVRIASVHQQGVMAAMGFDLKTFGDTQSTYFEKLMYERLA